MINYHSIDSLNINGLSDLYLFMILMSFMMSLSLSFIVESKFEMNKTLNKIFKYLLVSTLIFYFILFIVLRYPNIIYWLKEFEFFQRVYCLDNPNPYGNKITKTSNSLLESTQNSDAEDIVEHCMIFENINNNLPSSDSMDDYLTHKCIEIFGIFNYPLKDHQIPFHSTIDNKDRKVIYDLLIENKESSLHANENIGLYLYETIGKNKFNNYYKTILVLEQFLEYSYIDLSLYNLLANKLEIQT